MLKIFALVAFVHIAYCYQNTAEIDFCNAFGKKGECIPLKNCYSLRDSLKTTEKQKKIVFETIRKLQCGFVGNHPKVCCAIESSIGKNYAQYDVINTINDSSFYKPSDVRNHRNLKNLPEYCGNFPPFNHETLKNNDFPWTVQLIYSSENSLRFGCGGSIISNEHILTAAHCVTNLRNSQLVGVRLGNYQNVADYNCWRSRDNYRRTCALSDDMENRNIKYVISHPGYRTYNMQNDIAVIKLERPIDFGDTLSKYPICLPWHPDLMNPHFDESKITVSGSGISVLNGDHVDENAECIKKAESYFPIAVYGSNNNGQSLNSKYVQDGIISVNRKKCGVKGMLVYTRITNHLNWILDNLEFDRI